MRFILTGVYREKLNPAEPPAKPGEMALSRWASLRFDLARISFVPGGSSWGGYFSIVFGRENPGGGIEKVPSYEILLVHSRVLNPRRGARGRCEIAVELQTLTLEL